MDHLEKLIGPTLFKWWLAIVAIGIVSWAVDLTASAVRHQFFFCK